MRTFLILSALAGSLANASDSPLTPTEALASFKLEPGLRAELVAAEPLTASPCALTWDERGRLFVAENRGYPTGGPDGKPLGVIALLEDTDGDGRADKRTVFADGLTFPNGLSPWRGGLIVTCAPDVLWLADTNGDGRADVRRVLLTGFSTSGSTQLRVSHPTLGPDGWIYLTSGFGMASKITCPVHPERPLLQTSTDVRFHPDTLEVEAVDGRGQFGQTFDDFGRRFICMNRVQVQHVVMPSRYLKRNPNLAFTDVVQNCPDLVPNPLMKGGGGAARIYPISANVTTADSHAGTFTAACAVHIFRGDALPGYSGRAFSCDPTANLVHWDDLIPTGATFAARRSSNQVEFLASTDNWFRPVFLATGPDGALYVADMYRGTIEHPEYLPVEVRKRTDFEGGKGMGRIWRVTTIPELPPGVVPGLPPGPLPLKFNWKEPANWHGVNLAAATSEELCRALEDANGWRRDSAFRLLVERRDVSVVPSLRSVVANSARENYRAAGAALRLLALFGHLDDASLLLAARKPDYPQVPHTPYHPGLSDLREIMLELAGPRLATTPALQDDVLTWIRREDRIGFLAKLMTTGLSYERKRAELIVQTRAQPPIDPGFLPARLSPEELSRVDRWQRAALLVSFTGQTAAFLQDLSASLGGEGGSSRFYASPEFVFDLGRVAATEADSEKLTLLVERLADFARRCAETEEKTRSLLQRSVRDGFAVGMLPPGPRPAWEWELPALHGIAEGLRAQAASPNSLVLRAGLGSRADTNSLSALEAVALRSRRALTNGQPVVVQAAAATLLAEVARDEDRDLLLRLFSPDSSLELQRAALHGFIRLAGTNAAPALLTPQRWRGYSPAMREYGVGALLARVAHPAGLLDAIESGIVPANAIVPTWRTSFLKHKDEAIRKRAEALFTQPVAGDRMKAYEQSKDALALAPNAANGREVFKRACANCHRLDREGVAVGPDLFDVRNQPKETLLLHLIVPEFEIAPNFAGYTLETRDGRTLSGLIAGETPASVTLRQALGVEETVLRANIASLEASRLSLMPQEIEKTMTTQELADLLAYLKGEK